MNKNIKQILDTGVSIWLDDLNKDLLESGELTNLINEDGVTGVTTNPAILAKSGINDPDEQVMVIQKACDLFLPLYEKTDGENGRVSIEVNPNLADDTAGTITAAAELYKKVNRKNVLIKIPATAAGMNAIAETLSKGISVNVTLIFGLSQYKKVLAAFVDGIQAAADNGLDFTKIHSVASLFVSRVDTAVDALLEANGSPEALKLRGKIAVSNAKLCYDEYEKFFENDQTWKNLEQNGAHRQRPLWASTGVKNPDYSPTKYVDDLAFPNSVNTMPLKTLHALAENSDESRYPVDTDKTYLEDRLNKLTSLGIDLDKVVAELEKAGVQQFIDSAKPLLFVDKS
jgi:transaldolase